MDCEHLENAEQRKKLKAIENKLKGSFGSYETLLQFKKEINEILKNEPSISDQTENR